MVRGIFRVRRLDRSRHRFRDLLVNGDGMIWLVIIGCAGLILMSGLFVVTFVADVVQNAWRRKS